MNTKISPDNLPKLVTGKRFLTDLDLTGDGSGAVFSNMFGLRVLSDRKPGDVLSKKKFPLSEAIGMNLLSERTPSVELSTKRFPLSEMFGWPLLSK